MKRPVTYMYKLKDERSFKKIFDVTCSHGDTVYCEYLQDGVRKSETYRDLEKRSLDTAYTLQQRLDGIPGGTFIGIHFDNCPEWPAIFWGILMAGYNPILLDFRASKENLEYLLTQSGAGAIITDDAVVDNDILVITRNDLINSLKEPVAGWEPIWGKYLAYCTSGTTASSRIYVYDGAAVASNIYRSGDTFEVSPYLMREGDVRVLAFLPFYHIYGFVAIYCLYSVCGSTFVYLPDRDPMSILATSRDFGVTHIASVPLMWNNIVKKVHMQLQEASSLKRGIFRAMVATSLAMQKVAPEKGRRFAMQKLFGALHDKLLGRAIHSTSFGGASLSQENIRLMAAFGYPIGGGYGMTEVGIMCAESGENRKRRMSGSNGKPILEVKVVKEDGSTARSGSGQLFLRGDTMHIGRLKDGKMEGPLVDEEGFFATGDMVYVDKKGYLFCRGRSKDTIVPASGENVYPDELEEHFLNVIGIEELTILGVNDGSDSERITMLFRPQEDYKTGKKLNDISRKLHGINRKLPSYQQVQDIFVSEEPLPVTTSMKVQRSKIKAAIENGQWPMVSLEAPVGVILADEDTHHYTVDAEIMEGVRGVFSEVLNIKPEKIGDDDHFINTLGGDSLDAISLASQLEKRFSIVVDDSMLLRCTSVRELAREIERQISGEDLQHGSPQKPLQKQEPVTDFTQTDEYRGFQAMMGLSDYNPYFIKHDSTVKDTSVVDGKEIMNFASYNYCGLSGHPETVKAGVEALETLGSSASGSRLLTGEKSLYRELEEEIARWKSTEDAIVLVSGHATNVSFVGNFCDENDLILYDALAHNSIEQGCRLSKSRSRAFPHNDYNALENILESQRKYYRKVLIIIEGAYSMDGDIAPVPEFVRLKKKYGAFLMVDEAHSAGVIGATGKGVDEHFNLEPDDVDIKMGTLSKGIGSCGGYIAGKKALVEYLRYNLPGFVFSVGITPANAAVALASIRLLQKDPSMVQQLQKNIKTFVDRARKHEFDICLAGETAIIPIHVGDEFEAMQICRNLQERGVFVAPAIYPAVARGQARLRFCVTSDHKEEQIHYALDTLKEVWKGVETVAAGKE